jgi:dolichol-phosphate mannosyltransferase
LIQRCIFKYGTSTNKCNNWQIGILNLDVPKYKVVNIANKKHQYAVIVIVKNEGERLHSQLRKMVNHANPHFDILISDAPSSDNSTNPETLAQLGVTALIHLDETGGTSSSVRAALDYILKQGYDGVVLVDGNDKDDTKALKDFAFWMSKGYDYVQGSRFVKGGKGINTPFLRLLLIKLFHAPFISLICGKRFTDTTNGFRALSSRFCSDTKG